MGMLIIKELLTKTIIDKLVVEDIKVTISRQIFKEEPKITINKMVISNRKEFSIRITNLLVGDLINRTLETFRDLIICLFNHKFLDTFNSK